MRKTFADTIKFRLEINKNLMVFLGDISVGLFVNDDESLPDRVFNVGILEQSMVSFAAGVASEACLPVVHTISSFIVERAYEQIKLDLCYNNKKVILVSANGPYDYNKLGPTHHCSADIPILSQLENMSMLLPGRDEDVPRAIDKALGADGPTYVRLTSQVARISDEEIKEISERIAGEAVIFVGEALKKYEMHRSDFSHMRVFYVTDLNSFDRTLVEDYTNVTIYEPYSAPVLANNLFPRGEVHSFCYPKSIETGIYEEPNFQKRGISDARHR